MFELQTFGILVHWSLRTEVVATGGSTVDILLLEKQKK